MEKLSVDGPIKRRDRVGADAELWQPPAYSSNMQLRSRIFAWLRRFFDPAAHTVWNDLKVLLWDAAGTVLDVGCGAQPYRSLVPQRCRYTAIDSLEAKSRFGYDVPDTVYFDEKGEWPVADASISVVVCSEVLEHVLDPSTFLLRAWRSLKPGGKCILTVPFAARWHYIPNDYWRFTPSSLKHLLDGAAFRHVRVFSRGNPLSVACYKLMALFFALIFIKRSGKVQQWCLRLLGLSGVPLVIVSAILLNATIAMDWGDDCLGYTVVAVKP